MWSSHKRLEITGSSNSKLVHEWRPAQIPHKLGNQFQILCCRSGSINVLLTVRSKSSVSWLRGVPRRLAGFRLHGTRRWLPFQEMVCRCLLGFQKVFTLLLQNRTRVMGERRETLDQEIALPLQLLRSSSKTPTLSTFWRFCRPEKFGSFRLQNVTLGGKVARWVSVSKHGRLPYPKRSHHMPPTTTHINLPNCQHS